MRVTKTEYSSMTDKASKNSSLLKDCSCAFLVGGAICTIGHSLFLMYRSFGLQEIDSRAATSSTLIFLGAFLTVIGVYDDRIPVTAKPPRGIVCGLCQSGSS